MPEAAPAGVARAAWLPRLFLLLAALWLGLVATLALVSAPAVFAVLERAQAGQAAGRMFHIEAQAGLAFALLLYMLGRRIVRDRVERLGRGAQFPLEIALVLGALFCTVLGYHALQPMMEAARQGQGSWSFGALHGASSALFVLKGVLLLALTWRAMGWLGAGE